MYFAGMAKSTPYGLPPMCSSIQLSSTSSCSASKASAVRYASREALAFGQTRYTFAELGAKVKEATAAAMASGIEPGDRASIWAPNVVEWVIAALGMVSAGAALVPLNTRFKGEEAG